MTLATGTSSPWRTIYPGGNPLPAAPVADTVFLEAIASTLPGPIVAHGGRIDMLQSSLHPLEQVEIRNSVTKRVQEFTAGRTCARIALGRLGYEDVTIPVGKRRQPVWPEGIAGSISHAGNHCIAAVCTRNHFTSLGVDIEQATPLSDSLVDLVCSTDEKNRLSAGAGSMTGLLAKFMFSAKEAVFKCLFPVYGEELEFHDVALDIFLHEGRFTAQVSRFALNSETDLELRGRLACTSSLVVTSAVLHDDDIQHLSGWNPGHRLGGCQGRFLCGLGD